MTTCPHCGSSNAPGVRFCQSCGAGLGGAVSQLVQSTGPIGAVGLSHPQPAPQASAGPDSSTMWVVAAVAGLLFAAVGGMFLMGAGSGSGQGTASAPVATSSAAATATPTPTPAPTPAPAPKPVPAPVPARSTVDDGRQFCSITKVYRQDGQIWVELDFQQWFDGDDAEREAAEDGRYAENDYYIRNESKKLRRFPVQSSASVVTQDDGENTPYTLSRFYSGWRQANSMANLWYFTIDGGEVVRIEGVWVP